MSAPPTSTYVPRPIAFVELMETDGWRLKVYGIAAARPDPRPELVRAAKRLAMTVLPRAEGLSGVGFVGAHDARTGCYVFVCWWADENELHHRLFLGPTPEALRAAGPADSMGCVWDLAVIDHERRAWLDECLRPPGGPDLDGYLARRMSALV